MSELTATIFVRPETAVSVHDYQHPDLPAIRVVIAQVGDLTMHFSGGDDEMIVTTTNRLIDALTTLRDNAHDRLLAADAVAVA